MAPTSIQKASFRILIVDDDNVIRQLLRGIVAAGGYEHIDEADSGRAAVDAISKTEYHLVLLDKNMPGMDGLQTLQYCKTLRPHCEVIIVTAYGSIETAVQAMELGAYSYLTKPFNDVNAVLNRVEAALERAAVWQSQRELLQRLMLVLDELRAAESELSAAAQLERVHNAEDRLRLITNQLRSLFPTGKAEEKL